MSFIDDYLSARLGNLLVNGGENEQGHLVPPLLVEKVTAYLEVPEELLMDCGAIPDTRPRQKLW